MDHTPQFEFTCKVYLRDGTCFEETGLGPSKKEAKHKSAKNVLSAVNAHCQKHADAVTSNFFDSVFDSKDSTFGTIPQNCVVELEELLKKRRLPPPNIATKEPNEGVYEASCTVEHLRTQHVANTKKAAKREVARLMLEKIMEIGEEQLQLELNKTSSMASFLNKQCPISKRKLLERTLMENAVCTRPDSCKLLGRLAENFEDLKTPLDQSTNTFARKIVDLLAELENASSSTSTSTNSSENTDTESDIYGSREYFEKFVVICGKNSIPIRESITVEDGKIENDLTATVKSDSAQIEPESVKIDRLENDQDLKTIPVPESNIRMADDDSKEELQIVRSDIKFKGFYLLLVNFDKPLTFFGMNEDLETAKRVARGKCLRYMKSHFALLQAFNKTEAERIAESKRKEAAKKKHTNSQLRFRH